MGQTCRTVDQPFFSSHQYLFQNAIVFQSHFSCLLALSGNESMTTYALFFECQDLISTFAELQTFVTLLILSSPFLKSGPYYVIKAEKIVK